MNLLEGLNEEIKRNKALIEVYETIPTGKFARLAIARDLACAEQAIASLNTVQMLRSLVVLQENK